MKKLMLIRGMVITCLILYLFNFLGCKKDHVPEEQNLNKLKIWYQKNKKTIGVDRFSEMIPDWTAVYINTQANQTVYEITLLNPKKMFQTPYEIGKGEFEVYALKNCIRLLIFKDKASEQIMYAAFSSIINEGGDLNLSSIHYKQVNQLTGKVLFYNQKGYFSNGWQYQNGKIKGSIALSNQSAYLESVKLMKLESNHVLKNASGDPKDKKLTILRSMCTVSSIPDYAWSCVTVNDHTNCSPYVSGYTYTVTCETNGNGGDGSYNPEELIKNFGVNSNCANCEILSANFNEYLNAIRAAGLLPVDARPTELIVNGETYKGKITEIYDQKQHLVASFFKPDESSTTFPNTDSNYSIGTGGQDGTNFPANTSFVLPGGQFLELSFLPLANPSTMVTYSFYYSETEMEEIINNIQGPITGNGIDLYLVLKYRGSKLLDLSLYSTSSYIEVDDYSLAPNYDKNGRLLFYSAARLGTSMAGKNGIEYIIRADQLNAFKANVEYYIAAADWFYLNGIPDHAMIKFAASSNIKDRVSALSNLWGNAIKSPAYWAYLGTTLLYSATLIGEASAIAEAKVGISSSEYTFTESAGKHLKEIVIKGMNKGQLRRPYMNSPLTIQEIMTTGAGTPDATYPSGMNWKIPGNFRGADGFWELGINPQTKVVYHFNFTN